jgi:hypothetical protein
MENWGDLGENPPQNYLRTREEWEASQAQGKRYKPYPKRE